ncbi:MAG: lytic murein transglycosylase B [Betaproteobacteria bacterium RIFCSPLOWO2_12_FULL_62_13]|nr:MAG: lytic murein transglycosylase B [Betaproteobacteria bacterium RIFCSPLOWO2_12_FULL_62_13]
MALVAALVLGCVGPTSALAQRQLRPDIELFIDDMARKHRFDRAALRRVFRQAQPRPAVIRAISTPGTARPWHEFRSRYLDEARIAAGVSFWRDNAAALARASREYGVPEEIIVATIGIETLYGHQTGSFKVLEALTMLAFDYPQRADFFRGELEEFLLLAREAELDILAVRGSYAGAMGLPQFLPSSYRKYAVDFDGDGKPNLWGEAVDAIGSVANYYRSFGWQPGAPIAVRADPGKSDIEEVLAGGIKPHVRIGALKSRGVIPLVPVDEEAEVTLFTLEAEDGLQYWLGLQNFYVITRYNRSVNYAMAVYELARELRTLVNSNSETPPQ